MIERFSVAEIFGPTIQGEGPQVGEPCYFIRLGGCDYRCSWCDSMHAVDPEKVVLLPRQTPSEIVAQLESLPGQFSRVVISGGNPAVWELTPLIDALKESTGRIWRISIETQGSLFRDWMYDVDTVVLSPKPPSSTMTTDRAKLRRGYFDLLDMRGGPDVAVKIVVFDDHDLDYARSIAIDLNLDLLYLSIGTVADEPTADTLLRFQTLTERALDRFYDVPFTFKISPQMHVLAWGHKLGV